MGTSARHGSRHAGPGHRPGSLGCSSQYAAVATSPAVAARPVVSIPVPPGDAQTAATLRVMRDVVVRSIRNPSIVEFSRNLVRHVDGHSLAALGWTLREWLNAHVRFLPDPAIDGDWIRAPDVLIDEYMQHGYMRGDCDDAATLTATLGMAIGLFARFRAVGFDVHGPYSHVWCELYIGDDRWLTVDPTRGPVSVVPVRVLLLDVE